MTKGTNSLYVYIFCLLLLSSSELIILPSLLSCYPLDDLSEQLLNRPFLVCLRFSPFPLKPPPFPASRLHLLWDLLRFFASPPPSPILSLAFRRWALVLSRMRDGLTGESGLAAAIADYPFASCAFSRLPTPALSPSHPHVYSRSRARSHSCSPPYPIAHLHTRIPFLSPFSSPSTSPLLLSFPSPLPSPFPS